MREHRPNSRPKPQRRVQKDDRTKFDKWLEERQRDATELQFLFKIDPFAMTDRSVRTANVILVDRYNLLLRFSDQGVIPVWVEKANIVSCRVMA